MSTLTKRFLPLLSIVAALAVTGTPAAAGQCSHLEAGFNHDRYAISARCEQIARTLDYSVCRSRLDWNACAAQVRAPHTACLQRSHELAMAKHRELGECHRRHAARNGGGTGSAYDRVHQGAGALNSLRAPSISKRLTRFSLKAVRTIHNGAMIGLKGAIDATNTLGRHMPTYTYTPSRNPGSGYGNNSGSRRTSGGGSCVVGRNVNC